MSIAEITQVRTSLGLLTPKRFYLFGHPIAHSMSPKMHNTGFELLKFPYTYHLSESEDIEHVRRVIKEPDFGGASVTIPHKEIVAPLLNHITEPARIIGAVNTITSIEGILYGDNTDWLGIRQSVTYLFFLFLFFSFSFSFLFFCFFVFLFFCFCFLVFWFFGFLVFWYFGFLVFWFLVYLKH